MALHGFFASRMDHIARVTPVSRTLMIQLHGHQLCMWHGRVTGFVHGTDICPLAQLASHDRREKRVYPKCYSTRVTSCAHGYTIRQMSCNDFRYTSLQRPYSEFVWQSPYWKVRKYGCIFPYKNVCGQGSSTQKGEGEKGLAYAIPKHLGSHSQQQNPFAKLSCLSADNHQLLFFKTVWTFRLVLFEGLKCAQ